VERTADPNYVPTDEDILNCKVKSTEIAEAKFLIKGIMFKIHDVGDQRSDFKKW